MFRAQRCPPRHRPLDSPRTEPFELLAGAVSCFRQFPATPTNGAPRNAGTASSSKSSASRSQRSARRASRAADRAPTFLPRLPARPLDRVNDPVASRGRQRNEFAARALQREAVFVFAAQRIRSQRRDLYPVLHFRRLRYHSSASHTIHAAPIVQYASDSAANISVLARFNRLAHHVPVCVAIYPPPPNPCKPRPAPNHPKIRLAVAIFSSRPARRALGLKMAPHASPASRESPAIETFVLLYSIWPS